jgi:HSP20 family protein
MARQDIRTNEQQSQQQSQRSSTGGSQQGRAQQQTPGFLASRAVFPMSPFSLLNPFMVMRRMIDVVDPEAESTASSQRTWAPPVEVQKTDGTYLIRTELPGLASDNVRVEIADNALVVEGEREFKKEGGNGGMCSSELHYGHFYRAIPLPEGADVDHVDARFDNGVLEVRIPVAEQHNRQIPVQTTGAASQASSQSRS